MTLSNDSIQKLLPLLRPHLRDENERRAYLLTALGMDNPVLNRLVLNTPVDVFIPSMVKKLVDFGEIAPGKPALCALLEAIYEEVGVDNQAKIDDLLLQLRDELTETLEEKIGSESAITDNLIKKVEQYLSNLDYISLDKLVVREAKALAAIIQGELKDCPWLMSSHNQAQCQQCLEYLEAKSERFVRTLATIVYYGRQEELIELIAKAFRLIVKNPIPTNSCNDEGVYIRLYPLALAIYTVFMLGVQTENFKLLRTILDIRFTWGDSPNRKMIEYLVCLFSYANQALNSALGDNNKAAIVFRIKKTLLRWLDVLLEDQNTEFWKGEFILSLAFIESDGRFYWQALYLLEWQANSALKSFLNQKPLWLMGMYPNLEDMLQIFDAQAGKAANAINPFGGGFRGGAMAAFKGEAQY